VSRQRLRNLVTTTTNDDALHIRKKMNKIMNSVSMDGLKGNENPYKTLEERENINDTVLTLPKWKK